jgi:hypothetical protein
VPGLNAPKGSNTELIFTVSKQGDPRFNELKEAYQRDKELMGIIDGIRKMYGESDTKKSDFGLYKTFHDRVLYLSGQTTRNSRPALEWTGITDQKDIEKISEHMSHLGPVFDLIMLNRLRVGEEYICLNQSKL